LSNGNAPLYNSSRHCLCFVLHDCINTFCTMQPGTVTPGFRFVTEDGSASNGALSVITSSLTYSSDCIKALCVQPLRIPRATRKILFLYGIWRPRAGHPCLERRLAGPPSAQETASTLPSVPAAASPINGLRLVTWNIHSLRHKYIAVADTILSEGLDLLMVTESWHSSSTDVVVRRSAPPGYYRCGLPKRELQG